MTDYDKDAAPLGMPREIAQAIIAVAKQIKQLGADEKNEHAKYNYVSVDKFYAAIGPFMAEAGLALIVNEAHAEVREGKNGSPWLFANYELTFMHESGALSVLPISRSIAMPISGPQTYGAAQSYIEKQYLRQVFKIPTGDRDADETAPSNEAPPGRAGAPQSAGNARGGGNAYRRPEAAPAPSEAHREADKRVRELQAEIDRCSTVPEMESLRGAPAWRGCWERVRRAEVERGEDDPDAMADQVMDMLAKRIERRKVALLGNDAALDRYEV